MEAYPEYKEARWINSRADLFKAYSGRFFKAIEDELYHNPWFIKHTPIPDRPALIKALRQTGRYYYENDYKAFESSMIPELMKNCECLLYKYLLASNPEDAEFICRTLTGTNSLRTRTGVNCDVEGRRMSGDMCTSCGNGFTNLMVVLFIVESKGGDIRGFVEGDDGIFASTVKLDASDFTRCGFTVEIHEIADPCRAHFCGMTFAETGVCIKDPRRVLASFGWTASFIQAGSKIMDSLLRSKALSLYYEMPQCPILGVLSRETLRLTRGVSMTHVEDTLQRGYDVRTLGDLDISPFEPGHDTRELFSQIFHVSIEQQLAVERLIEMHRLDEISTILPPHDDMLHYFDRYIEVG